MRLTLAISVAMAFAQLVHGLHDHARGLATALPQCNATSTSFFIKSLSAASDGCTDSTSYDWDGDADPTTAQRTVLCKCTVTAFSVPKCTWTKQGKYLVSTSEHFKFVYDCASTSGKATPAVTEVETFSDSSNATSAPSNTTTAPTATTATPSTTAASNSTAAASYCTVQMITTFTKALKKQSACMGETTYDWGGNANPTQAEYGQMCKCPPPPFDSFEIPECSVLKGPDTITLAIHYNWVGSTQCATYSPSPANTSSSNAGTIGGIAGGVVAVILLIIAVVLCKRKKKQKEIQQQQYEAQAMRSPAGYHPVGLTPQATKNSTDPRASTQSHTTHTTISTANGSVRASGTGSWGTASRGTDPNFRWTETGKWDDPAIMAVRIPHDAIFFGALLSRGGFGEVFQGTYRGETVAIKQLLPEKRKDLEQIDNFLGEVKLMSSLEHERIVKFIGVAWNSLSDACLVVEYMENGDLRSVLNRWDHGDEQRPNGFDADKVRIALHVAHALTYLHSLQPMVVHRDLKAKNILLDENFDAKLTDFGISRERADATMTAGVGSSLWMAPEVMMGERYNEKADIFSFGVVLSELDTHQQPYFHAKVTETGEKVPEAAILQQVMLGRLSVGFTDRADPELVQLGRDCVNLDPKTRPTAAQALHRVHQVMQGWHKAMDF